MIKLTIKSIKLLTQIFTDIQKISHVDGLGRFAEGGFGGLGSSVGAQSGLLRFFEFFLSMQSALDEPFEHFIGVSNAFKSSMISGLTSITSSAMLVAFSRFPSSMAFS